MRMYKKYWENSYDLYSFLPFGNFIIILNSFPLCSANLNHFKIYLFDTK